MAEMDVRIETTESTRAKIAEKMGLDQPFAFDLVDRRKYGPTRWGAFGLDGLVTAFPGSRGSSVLPCCDYSIALLTVLFNAQNSQNSTVNIVDIDTVNRVDIVV